MRVRFIGSGEPGENAACEVFGLSFPMGEWVECDHPKLAANPAFEHEATPEPKVRVPAAFKKFDHNGDGKPGGSLPKRRQPRKKV